MTCYRVLMFDPKHGLHWQPIFVGDSLEYATERALTAYPERKILDVIALHLSGIHGWQDITTVAA